MLLGLSAWILPLAGLALRRRRWVASACSVASFGAALLAVVAILLNLALLWGLSQARDPR